MNIKQFSNTARHLYRQTTCVACALFLTSCATTQQSSNPPAFRFTVMQYKQPVEVTNWTINPVQAVNPEGAALNVVVAITHGDLTNWLAEWETSERPALSAEEQQQLLIKWAPIKNGKISILDRVVAGTEEIIELSVTTGGHEEIVQVPLKRQEGRWWLTSMDADSEYLHWKTASNKILEPLDPQNLRNYIRDAQASASLR